MPIDDDATVGIPEAESWREDAPHLEPRERTRSSHRRYDEPDRIHDPQDRAFGAAAARDQELIDDLEDAGLRDELEYAAVVIEEEGNFEPRAGGKARPAPGT
jgi:hypothetical protein